jgi:hypothetical protein
MSQSTMNFNGGQPRPGFKLNSESTFSARGHPTPTTVSSPDQIGLNRPVQSRMIPGSKVPGGNSTLTLATANGPVQGLIPGFKVPGGNPVRQFAATNGPFHTSYNSFGSPMKLDLDRWAAPVSVCHACGSAIK